MWLICCFYVGVVIVALVAAVVVAVVAVAVTVVVAFVVADKLINFVVIFCSGFRTSSPRSLTIFQNGSGQDRSPRPSRERIRTRPQTKSMKEMSSFSNISTFYFII